MAGCGNSDPVDGLVTVEAVVFGRVETKSGEPVEGVAIRIEAWRGACGVGDPIVPGDGDAASRLVTDSSGAYLGLLRVEADPFDACLTLQAEPPAVLHLLPEADTGAVVSLRTADTWPDSAEVNFILLRDLPVLYAGIAAEGARTCGLSTRGAAFCWGSVGREIAWGCPRLHFDSSAVPLPVRGGLEFVEIDPADFHACGITRAGAAYCWGSNELGELGEGPGRVGECAGSSEPVRVVGENEFAAITTGSSFFSCGVTLEGSGWCWGNNFSGELGIGSRGGFSPAPAAVAGGLPFLDIDAGGAFACGVIDSGEAYCWGTNGRGNLGNGTTEDSPSPVAVAGGLTFAQVVAARGGHACGVAADQETYCWGDNRFGQLGDGTTTDATTPVQVLTSIGFVTVTVGDQHSCGLSEAGRAHCWGLNDRGQLGDGTQTDRHTPTAVVTQMTFTSLAAGEEHTCGLDESGRVYCWGRGEFGELGTGRLVDESTPVAVADPE